MPDLLGRKAVGDYLEVLTVPMLVKACSTSSGSGRATAPERRCGLGLRGAYTGASEALEADESSRGGSTIRTGLSTLFSGLCLLVLRLLLSRPLPIAPANRFNPLLQGISCHASRLFPNESKLQRKPGKVVQNFLFDVKRLTIYT